MPDLNWEAIGAIGEVAGAIFVVATLFYLSRQIRQNAKAQQAVVVDSLATSIADINVPATQDPKLGTALAIAIWNWEEATPEQRTQAHFFIYSIFKLCENAWFHWEAGVLTDDQWAGWERMARFYYWSPGIRSHWWPKRRRTYALAFQEHLEKQGPGTDVSPLHEIFGLNVRGGD